MASTSGCLGDMADGRRHISVTENSLHAWQLYFHSPSELGNGILNDFQMDHLDTKFIYHCPQG